MNRRNLLTTLLGASLLPFLPAKIAWADDTLTPEAKARLREALPYPEVTFQMQFSFSETDGVQFDTATSEKARNEASKKKAKEDWDRLKDAPIPTDPEAKAAFLVKRGRTAAQGIEDPNAGSSDFAEATTIYRSLAAKATDPTRKASLLANAADSGAAGKDEALKGALADAREAVKLAPKSPDTWKALGKVLMTQFGLRFSKAGGEILPGVSQPISLFFASLQNPALLRKIVRMPGVAEAEVELKEAAEAYKKAFDLQPEGKGFLSGYAFCRFFSLMFDAAHALSSDTPDTEAFAAGLIQSIRVSDLITVLEKAVESPIDILSLTFPQFLIILSAGVDSPEAAAQKLTSREKTLLERILNRLTVARRDKKQPKEIRVSSALASVTLQFMTQDRKGLRSILEEARALDPEDVRVVELLMAISASEQDYAVARGYAEGVLKLRNTAYDQLAYAKTLALEDKPATNERIADAYRAALKLEPENINAAIGLAVWLLKSSGDHPDRLPEAGLLLKKTAENSKDKLSKEDTLSLYLATIGFYGLYDQLEGARSYIKQARMYFPDDEDIEAIGKIIG